MCCTSSEIKCSKKVVTRGKPESDQAAGNCKHSMNEKRCCCRQLVREKMTTPSMQSALVVSALPKEHFKENIGNVTISDISQLKDCRKSKNHTCEKCGKTGHFAVCCHTGESRGGATGGQSYRKPMYESRGRGRGKQNVRNIEKQDTELGEEDTFYVFSDVAT